MKTQIIKKDHPEFKGVLSLALKNKRHHLEKLTRQYITEEIQRTRKGCAEIRFDKKTGVTFFDEKGNAMKLWGKPET